MICKICNLVETDNTSGICWKCLIMESEIIVYYEPLFYPYDNLIDWALNRHT
jgi:hypothetical protein